MSARAATSRVALPAALLLALALPTACKETEEQKALRGLDDHIACAEGRKSACDRRLTAARASCEGGDLEGCVLLGIIFQGGDQPDEAESVRLFLRACDGGNGSGCWYLGNAHANGRGTAKDPARARDAYDRGCMLKRENACIALGDMYSDGGALHDRTKALAAYDAGCAIPYKGACDRAAALRGTPRTPRGSRGGTP